MIVVADTSPITALLHLGQLHLLKKLYDQVYIPPSVVLELRTLVSFGYDISFLTDKETFIERNPIDKKLIEILNKHLDIGEAEAIALAKEVNADLLLIDEKLGKQFAEEEHINCKGTIGILILAKDRGYIPALKPLLDNLVNNLKFRLSTAIYNLALKKAGEE
jgi:predicted nucleic acid-binding protein